MSNRIATPFILLSGSFFMAGCVDDGPARNSAPAETKKVELGKNVSVEIEGGKRRVLVNAVVCLRDGQLEQFLTRKNTKEHEAVLAADIDARHIHTALVLAQASPGKPVKFNPEYQPASGDRIKITLEYKDDKGKLVRVPAQKWIRNIRTKSDMQHDWIFGGSLLIGDPLDKTRQPFYAANDGDVICLSNFETAMLDLPVNSPKDNVDLVFEANTERIPPLKTPVTVILEKIEAAK